MADAARVLDVIAGYDPRDPVTAHSVGHIPESYSQSLRRDALRGARIGVLRIRRDTSATAARDSSGASPDTAALRRDSADRAEFAKVRPIFDRSIADLRAQGAIVVDSLQVPTVPGRRPENNYETEEATDSYLAQHPNVPYRSLKEILLAGGVTPTRARSLMAFVNRSTADADYGALLRYREALRIAVLKLMADHQLDALVYATYDAAPSQIPGER